MTRELMLIVKRDIKNSFSLNKYKLLGTALIFFVFCFMLYYRFMGTWELQGKEYAPSFADLLLYIFSGMKVYIPAQSLKFEIPITWLSIQLYIAFMIGNYANRDMSGQGLQILLRTTRKSFWFIGKVAYCFVSVALFYLTGYAAVFVYSALAGTPSLSLSGEIYMYVVGINASLFSASELAVGLLLLPILTSFLLSLFQLLISLWVKPIFSYIFVVAYTSASAYYVSYFLIGNYSMLFRNEKVVSSDIFLSIKGISGIDQRIALAVLLAAILLSVVLGCISLKKYDFLEKAII